MKNLLAFGFTVSLPILAFAAPEKYVIDTNHTKPRFEYNHLGFSTQSSRFDTTTGSITLDMMAKTGEVEVEIGAKSVNTGSEKFNEHIQDKDFFDTEKYPLISYKSVKLNFEGDKLVSVDGNLTMKGITKPVMLEVTSLMCKPHPMLKKEACGANVIAKIKRSDFNMGKHAPLVSDEVTLIIPVEAVKP